MRSQEEPILDPGLRWDISQPSLPLPLASTTGNVQQIHVAFRLIHAGSSLHGNCEDFKGHFIFCKGHFKLTSYFFKKVT